MWLRKDTKNEIKEPQYKEIYFVVTFDRNSLPTASEISRRRQITVAINKFNITIIQ